MKKVFFMIVALALGIATTQGQEQLQTIRIDSIVGQMNLCDFDSGLIVKKRLSCTRMPFWIDENDQVTHADSIIITANNDGKLVYIEKNIDLLLSVNITFIEDTMPAPRTDTAWLKESVWQEPLPLTLKATPTNMGYLYTWHSSQWPMDSTFQGYELIVRSTGNFLGLMSDNCLHISQTQITVDKGPVLDFITTNRYLNRNELKWPSKGTLYDSVAIIKDDDVVAICSKFDESWTDPISNNEFGTPAYKLAAYVNGRIIPESSSFWRTGVTLSILPDTDTTIYFNFFGPNTEEGVAFNGYIKFFRLYSYDSNNEELIADSIPNYYNAIFDIKNNHESWYIAAVLWNGREIYSNIVTTEYIMSNSEKTADKIQVFPNPVTNGILCISTDDAAYKIYNANGQQVKSGRCSERLDISDLSSGVYAIEIREKQSTTTIKTIKFIVE